MNTHLPQAFLERMEEMLKEEFPAFLESYQAPRQFGLRINTKKISTEKFLEISPFHLTPIPWVENGFFYGSEDRPSRHPYYQAGLYYLQEPSAMTPASRLPVSPGDIVLDLCAAPGGKATELGSRLKGRGLLVANDISNSRAKALMRNLELWGIENSLVTTETPRHLSQVFPEYFHKILIDAPCSGEGMFRKDADVAKTWDPSRPDYFSSQQKEIVTRGISMLRPGGMLLYSTCTFSPLENEGVISFILENFPQMELLDIPGYQGFSKGCPQWGNGDPRLEKCVRIFPHHMAGEGHFLALLAKKEEGSGISFTRKIPAVSPSSARSRSRKEKNSQQKSSELDKSSRLLLEDFFREVSLPLDLSRMEVRNAHVYALPEAGPESVNGLRFLRWGLYLGELKKNRFEPSQPLAMTLSAGDYPRVLNLSCSDQRIERYLGGETLLLDQAEASSGPGWYLVCAEGYSLGWGKVSGNLLKNKYPAGWRH